MKRARGGRARRALPLLALALTSAARVAHAEPSPLPERVQISVRPSVQPCAALPFDAAAYLAALRVELVALGVTVMEADATATPSTASAATTAIAIAATTATTSTPAPAPVPELTLSSHACDDQLLLRLQLGTETRDATLLGRELPVLGRERALALVSIERLQRAWPTLAASASTAATAAPAAPPTAPPTAAKATPQPARRATSRAARSGASQPTRRDHRALGQGALSAGLRFSTAAPLASLGLTLDRSLSRSLSLGGALSWRSDSEGLVDATSAHSLTAGPRVELSLLELGSVELTAALGLAAGVGWIVTDRAGASAARVSSSPAALGLATGALGLRASLPWQVFLQTGVAADYALLGARFDTPSGRRLAELTGARFAAFVGVGARLGG